MYTRCVHSTFKDALYHVFSISDRLLSFPIVSVLESMTKYVERQLYYSYVHVIYIKIITER